MTTTPDVDSRTPGPSTKDDLSPPARIPKLLGLLVVLLGIVFLAGGAAGWFTVQSQLADENITVADDAKYFSGEKVNGPLTAYSQADTIKGHILEATGGKTYAELEMDDPQRDMAMQGASIRSALFTSTLAFGVSALAAGSGFTVIVLGLAVITGSGRRK